MQRRLRTSSLQFSFHMHAKILQGVGVNKSPIYIYELICQWIILINIFFVEFSQVSYFLIIICSYFIQVDSFATSRESDIHEATRRILSVLLRQVSVFIVSNVDFSIIYLLFNTFFVARAWVSLYFLLFVAILW